MLGVFAHDAGGAEIVSSWLKSTNISFEACVKGPAVKVFKKRFPEKSFLPAEVVLDLCERVLCGTSWQSKMELDAIDAAKARNKYTVAYLDHWSNYEHRFLTKNGSKCFPDEIWVGDQNALELAKITFPEMRINFVKNQFFEEARRAFTKYQLFKENAPNKRGYSRVLYVSEAISEHGKVQFNNPAHFGYDDFRPIYFFLDNLKLLKTSIEQIVIRPHPSEDVGKFEHLISSYPIEVKIENKCDIFKHIIMNDIIVGCQSMAMVLGLLAKKTVISVIPPEGAKSCLPQKEIINFKDLVDGA